MPARLRQSTGFQADAAPSDLYKIPGLTFNDPLTWRAGKAIAVADLLDRLQNLSADLRKFDQDQVDPESFRKLAHDLANANLLGHKDKGVRAWTLTCIVDVLKICAPNAPFSATQLKVRAFPSASENCYQFDTGYLHDHYNFDSAVSLRSIRCLQQPACLRPRVSCRI